MIIHSRRVYTSEGEKDVYLRIEGRKIVEIMNEYDGDDVIDYYVDFTVSSDVSYTKMPKEAMGDNGLYLFGMKTCTNCKTAKQFFDENKVNYSYIDAQDNIDASMKYGIMHTPTLVAVNGGTVQKFDTLASIEDYIKQRV